MRKLILLLITLTIFSCNKDIENIEVKGIVKDAITKKPLKGIEITIICWKYGNSPDQSYSEDETIKIKTNEDGIYTYNFDKGAFVEVMVSNLKYKEAHEVKYIHSKKNRIDILLHKK